MKTQNTINTCIALALLAAAGLTQAGTPATPITSPEPAGEGWWFRVAPYGWLTAIEGDVGVGPLSTPVDVSMSDTLDSLDMTFMGVFEAGYGPWSLGVDVMYGKLSQDIEAGGHLFDSFRFEQKQWFITPVVGYRIVDTGSYQMGLYAGARITALEVDLTGRLAHHSGEITRGEDSSWADPIVGLRGQANMGDHWFFRYSGDIGGFGVNSDLVWSAFAGFGYSFNENASVLLGYRGLGLDYTKDEFSLDIISHGPIMGAEFRF